METEDKWSPTASFRALKMFLANYVPNIKFEYANSTSSALTFKPRHATAFLFGYPQSTETSGLNIKNIPECHYD
jgi:hypothetical protein